ncbi:MAG: acyltransferase family protein [Bacteroidales bacterium]|nr:acyltransferase family protein [Bacteroidales bacterium]MCM1146237.1 acyltransferase family protein [Bacteroidales bacterium]MCM1205325.1 acyltransferase family protein [Bacillota bacterium]MCM1509588.1 acyltransferase family protein [Clostridium sp.]
MAKGITMLMVIWMHSTNNMPKVPEFDFINRFISIMYMPCFFLISGFFLKNEHYRIFCQKRIKTLIWPMLFVYVLSYVFALAVCSIKPELLKNNVSFWNIFFSRNFTNGPIWFLSALFFSLNVVYFIRKSSNEWLRWILAFCVCAVGFYWNRFVEWRLPLFFDTGLTAVGFVFVGSYIRRVMNGMNRRAVLLCLAVVCYVYASLWGVGCSMQNNLYSGHLPTFFLSAIAGSIIVLAVSKCISNNQMLQYIGRNSLVILCFHMFVLMGTSFIIKKIVNDGCVALVICFAVTAIMSVAIIPIIKRILFFVFK